MRGFRYVFSSSVTDYPTNDNIWNSYYEYYAPKNRESVLPRTYELRHALNNVQWTSMHLFKRIPFIVPDRSLTASILGKHHHWSLLLNLIWRLNHVHSSLSATRTTTRAAASIIQHSDRSPIRRSGSFKFSLNRRLWWTRLFVWPTDACLDARRWHPNA